MRVAKISAIRIVECESREAGKVFKIKKRILSGVENLDNMRFIVERFTSFSPQIEFYPASSIVIELLRVLIFPL